MHPGHLAQQPCSPLTCGHRHPRPQAELAGHGTGEGMLSPPVSPSHRTCRRQEGGPGQPSPSWLGRRLLSAGVGGAGTLTFVEVPPELVVGAALHDLGHVLRLLVDGHGAGDGARGRRGGHLDLDGARLGDLAVKLLQQRRILQGVGTGLRLAVPTPRPRLLCPPPGVPATACLTLSRTPLGFLPSKSLSPAPTHQCLAGVGSVRAAALSAPCSQAETLIHLDLMGWRSRYH